MATVRPPRHEPLDLDYETAPETARKSFGRRAYVGGVMYLEGIIVLAIGIMLLTTYWPPVSAYGRPPNPISRIGLWVSVVALVYMIVVGVVIFAYNLCRPGSKGSDDQHLDCGVVSRARRYASMKKRTFYIFDKTIRCAKDAEDAMKARKLY